MSEDDKIAHDQIEWALFKLPRWRRANLQSLSHPTMKTWNYRLIRRGAMMTVHEVYYDRHGEPIAYTEEEVSPSGATMNELLSDTRHYLGAFSEPILDAKDFEARDFEARDFETRPNDKRPKNHDKDRIRSGGHDE